MSDKKRVIAFKILFWLLYFLYEWLGHGAATDQYAMYFESACFNIATAWVVSFLAIHLFVQKYYHQKITFWISQIVLAVLFVLLRRIYHYYMVYPIYFPFAHGFKIYKETNSFLVVLKWNV
jgi:two-component system, LytTR family, sensor kinase